METGSANRPWKTIFKEEISRKSRYKIRKQIKKTLQGDGLSTKFLTDILKGHHHFLGIFPQDYLIQLRIQSFPVMFILNLDFSTQPGSHWLGIKIDNTCVYIYDSLGLKPDSWTIKPDILLDFLNQFSKSHKVYCTHRLQTYDSAFCGLYALYFILSSSLSFSEQIKPFCGDLKLNDIILSDLYQ